MIERICALSDTHTYHRRLNLPPCDLLIFAGDCMGSGYELAELTDFLDWFNEASARYKIMVAGNHDRFVENHPKIFRQLLHARYPEIIYLEDEGIALEGWRLWGTPHTKEFHHWAFNRTPAQQEALFGKIPEDTDILITHGPAKGVLDQVVKGVALGEEPLTAVITQRLLRLKFHFFGHIHAGYGRVQRGRYTAFNCAVCTEAYAPKNAPHCITIGGALSSSADEPVN